MKRKLLFITFIGLFGCLFATNVSALDLHSADNSFISSLDLSQLSQEKAELDFTISPNPASTKINLRVLNLDSEVTLTVIDVLGKKILSKSLSQVNTSIDVSGWNNGVYLIRITSDKKTQTKRFVKQ
ncbi:MAG: T9SS type A sorting domain-containing protein [Flavobacteriaceae bacterium]|nr:T9SS type A sorting domain-containing protein [Flavobacteriaceae bacterium]